MTKFKIEKFKTELGEHYLLVETIWNQILKENFHARCSDALLPHEVPIDQCTDLEKILLACIAYLEDGEDKIILTETFLMMVYDHHKITRGTTIKIRKPFFIVIV